MSRGRAQGDLVKGKVTQGSHRLLIRLTSLGSCLLMDGPPAAGPPLCSLGTEIRESQWDMPLPGAPAEWEPWTSLWLAAGGWRLAAWLSAPSLPLSMVLSLDLPTEGTTAQSKFLLS